MKFAHIREIGLPRPPESSVRDVTNNDNTITEIVLNILIILYRSNCLSEQQITGMLYEQTGANKLLIKPVFCLCVQILFILYFISVWSDIKKTRTTIRIKVPKQKQR